MAYFFRSQEMKEEIKYYFMLIEVQIKREGKDSTHY